MSESPRSAPPHRALRLLLFYDCLYPESVGGVEHRNFELGQALARRGHHVTLAGFARQGGPLAGGLEVLALARRQPLYTATGRRSTWQAIRLAWAALRLDLGAFDVVEASSIPYLHLFPLAWRCRARRVPLLVTWYEYWGRYWRRYLGPLRWLPYAAIERLAAGLGAAAIADSALTAKRLARRRGAPVPVVPVGIPAARIRAASAAAPSGPPLIYAGRLLREKRLDLLLHALARLATPAALLVVGEGPDQPRLADLARTLGLGERVVFAGKLAGSEDVWSRLGGALLAVQPSEREGFGLFPLEAMAAGLPVVHCSSPESAVRELVPEGVAGREVEATPGALAAVLDALLADPRERRRLGEGARRRAADFDWDEIAAGFEARLSELAAGGR